MRRLILSLIATTLLLTFNYCASDGDNNSDDNSPVPTITSLTPSSKAANIPPFTLTVNGTNFSAKSVIVFNNVEKQTTFASSTQLTCQIDTSEIQLVSLESSQNPGFHNIQNKSITVIVRNPSSEGGDSSPATFTVLSNPEFNQFRSVPGGYEHQHSVVDESGTIYLVWHDWVSANDRYDIFFSKSSDYGVTWSQRLNITYPGAWYINTYSFCPFIARDSSGMIYVSWLWGSGDTDLLLRTSNDNGNSWSATTNAIAQSDSSKHIEYEVKSAFVIDNNGYLNAMWTYYDLKTYSDNVSYSRSTDKGNTWGIPKVIQGFSGIFKMIKMAIANDGTIYLLIEDWSKDDYKIYFLSSNNGTTWSQPLKLNTPEMGDNAHKPAIALDSQGNIHTVMSVGPVSSPNIWYRKSTDKGVSWSSPQNLSNNANNSTAPQIVLDRLGNINVVWYEGKNLFFCRSINNGTSWTTPANITNFSDGAAGYPFMTVDNDCNIYIFWEGNPPPTKTVGLYFNFSKK